jgi:hypothetical protein
MQWCSQVWHCVRITAAEWEMITYFMRPVRRKYETNTTAVHHLVRPPVKMLPDAQSRSHLWLRFLAAGCLYQISCWRLSPFSGPKCSKGCVDDVCKAQRKFLHCASLASHDELLERLHHAQCAKQSRGGSALSSRGYYEDACACHTWYHVAMLTQLA